MHAQACDEYGNAQCWGGTGQERDKAKAADMVIVQADEIVGSEVIQKDPSHTTVPGLWVDYVVHAPFGAHPTFSSNNYAVDEEHLKIYIDLARAGRAQEYIDKYVLEPKDHYEYLERVGGMRRARLECCGRPSRCASTPESIGNDMAELAYPGTDKYSMAEFVTIILARQAGGTGECTGGGGANQAVSLAANRLAQITVRPDLWLFTGGAGVYNGKFDTLPIGTWDPRCGHGAECKIYIADVVDGGTRGERPGQRTGRMKPRRLRRLRRHPGRQVRQHQHDRHRRAPEAQGARAGHGRHHLDGVGAEQRLCRASLEARLRREMRLHQRPGLASGRRFPPQAAQRPRRPDLYLVADLRLRLHRGRASRAHRLGASRLHGEGRARQYRLRAGGAEGRAADHAADRVGTQRAAHPGRPQRRAEASGG